MMNMKGMENSRRSGPRGDNHFFGFISLFWQVQGDLPPQQLCLVIIFSGPWERYEEKAHAGVLGGLEQGATAFNLNYRKECQLQA